MSFGFDDVRDLRGTLLRSHPRDGADAFDLVDLDLTYFKNCGYSISACGNRGPPKYAHLLRLGLRLALRHTHFVAGPKRPRRSPGELSMLGTGKRAYTRPGETMVNMLLSVIAGRTANR
jgi:hypothetical protein